MNSVSNNDTNMTTAWSYQLGDLYLWVTVAQEAQRVVQSWLPKCPWPRHCSTLASLRGSLTYIKLKKSSSCAVILWQSAQTRIMKCLVQLQTSLRSTDRKWTLSSFPWTLLDLAEIVDLLCDIFKTDSQTFHWFEYVDVLLPGKGIVWFKQMQMHWGTCSIPLERASVWPGWVVLICSGCIYSGKTFFFFI